MTERGYHIHCAEPEIEVNNSVVFPEGGVIASLMEGGIRIAGQAEFGPIDAPLNLKRKSILSTIALEMFPDISLEKDKGLDGTSTKFSLIVYQLLAMCQTNLICSLILAILITV